MTINDKAANISPRHSPRALQTNRRRAGRSQACAAREGQGQKDQPAERERLRGDNEAAQRDAQKTIKFQKQLHDAYRFAPRREFRRE